MATEKAKLARDLIHQQYVHLRVENMRDGEGEDNSQGEERMSYIFNKFLFLNFFDSSSDSKTISSSP
jgi:hypothetical protein